MSVKIPILRNAPWRVQSILKFTWCQWSLSYAIVLCALRVILILRKELESAIDKKKQKQKTKTKTKKTKTNLPKAIKTTTTTNNNNRTKKGEKNHSL
jgi:DNA integrity scanning protein DisA with diadenylate cyclase activity